MAAYLIFVVMTNSLFYGKRLTKGPLTLVFWNGQPTTAEYLVRYIEALEQMIEQYFNSSDDPLSKAHAQEFYNIMQQGRYMQTSAQYIDWRNNLAQYWSRIAQFEHDELNFERSTPSAQANMDTAAGMSRYASLNSLNPSVNATSDQIPSYQNNFDPVQQATQIFSSVVDGISTAISFAQFGISLPAKFAENVVAQSGADIAQQQIEGMNTASMLNDVFEKAKNVEGFDSSKLYGYQDMVDLISQLGSDGDDTLFGEFKRDYIDTGKTSNIFARQYGLSSNEAMSTNLGFAERMFNATKASGLQLDEIQSIVSKNNSEVYKNIADEVYTIGQTNYLRDYVSPFTASQTNLINAQERGQNAVTELTEAQIMGQLYSNRIARANADYSENVLPLRRDVDMEDLRTTLTAMLAIPEGEPRTAYLQTKLNDAYTAHNLATFSFMMSSDQVDEIKNNPSYRELVSLFSKEEVQSAFHTLATRQQIRSSTASSSESYGVGPLKLTQEHSVLMDYPALIDFNINKKTNRYQPFIMF